MGDLNEFLGNEPAPEETQPEAEQPQEAQPEASTGEDAATPAEAKEDPIETHRKGLETAVVAERRKRQEAEQRAAAIEAQLQQFMKQQQPAPTQDEGAPDPNQYQDNPQEYWRLLARYEARQELKAERERFEEERREREAQTQQRELMAKVAETVQAGQAKYPDFDAVINDGLGPYLNPLMQRALGLTKNGHDVAYFLAKNPLEAARISQLDPMQMLIELGEVRARATNPPKQAIPRTLTTARDARGQFASQTFDGPTPLDSILSR